MSLPAGPGVPAGREAAAVPAPGTSPHGDGGRRTFAVGPGDRPAVRWAALAVASGVAVFAHLHRLGVPSALVDEVTYAESGRLALDGVFTTREAPYLARYLFGAAQRVLGDGVASARVVSAAASLLTGAVLFRLGRRLAGWWVGLLALVLWSTLPQATRAPDGTITMVKLGRSALLEPVLVALLAVAVLLAWRWGTSGRLRPALLAGVALGAAAGTKATGVLLLPVVALAGVAMLGPSRRSLGQAAALGTAATATALATYLPLGGAGPDAIRTMVEFQAAHAAAGHPVVVAGAVRERAPWWAHAWWQWRSLGTPGALALGGAVGAALVWAPCRAGVRLLAAAVAVPVVWLSLFTGFGLPHYLHVWQAPLALLAALGVATLLGRRGLARAAGLGLVVVLGAVGAQTLATVATTGRAGYAAAGDLVTSRTDPGGAVVVWGHAAVAELYLPGAQVVGAPAEATAPVVAVIVDPGVAARYPRPDVEALLRDRDDLEPTAVDDLRVHLPPPAGPG